MRCVNGASQYCTTVNARQYSTYRGTLNAIISLPLGVRSFISHSMSESCLACNVVTGCDIAFPLLLLVSHVEVEVMT